MKKTAGMSDSGEAKDRFKLQLKSRLEQQLDLEDALSMAEPSRAKDRALMGKLFAQAGVATTAAPSLQPDLVAEAGKIDTTPPPLEGTKVASVRDVISQRLEGSPAPRVDLYMEKNAHLFYTEAQRNFPELLKVGCDAAKARPVRKVTPNPTQGAIPVRANGAGGSA